MFGQPIKNSGVVNSQDVFCISHREIDKIRKPSYTLMRAAVQIRKEKFQIFILGRVVESIPFLNYLLYKLISSPHEKTLELSIYR